MGYSPVPIALGGDNLGFGGDACLVWTQFGEGAWHKRTDAQYASGDIPREEITSNIYTKNLPDPLFKKHGAKFFLRRSIHENS